MTVKPYQSLLLRLRTSSGASLRELGATLDESYSQLGKVEQRVRVAPYRMICKLSEFFGLMPEDLFDERGFALQISQIDKDERQLKYLFGGES